jgi:Raf kinase inhibitor-like YbhB/YbcL family protein
MYDPYEKAFPATPFNASSPDFSAGGALPNGTYASDRGPGTSPAIAWTGLPENTKSVVITAFDPDAPIPGGFWHWAVINVPASVVSLAAGAGADDQALPLGATHHANSLGLKHYAGVKPPPGTGTHRLVLCVTALSVETLALPPEASMALLNISMIEHTLGRALLVGTSEPAA